jgi:hypothetical protein
MSTVNNGPQIVRSGLVLDLDASYMRSYSPNVMPNPTNIFAWSGTGNNNCTLTADATITRQSGSIPLKMVMTGTDPYTGTYHVSTWNLAPAANGQTWTLSFYAKGSETLTGNCYIFGANSSGNYIEAFATSFTVTNTWQRFSLTSTFSNASTAFIQIRLGGSSGQVGKTIWWDGLQVERASAATNFNPYYFGNTSWRDVSSSGNIFNSTLYTYPSFVQSSSQSYFSFINNGTIQNNIYCYSTGLVTATSTQMQYTRLGWFYLTSYSDAWSPIFQNVIGNNSDMGLTVYSNGTIHFRQYTNSITGGTASQDYGVSSDGTVLINRWNFAAIVVNRTGNQVSFYINGNFDSTKAINVIGNSESNEMLIGGAYADSYSGVRMFKGRIASVCHYNRLLTAAEVSQNYEATKTRFGL